MTCTNVLRTPDDRFVGLPDFPFEPHYVDALPGYEGLRAHYLDVGPRDAARTFLCLHGEPTWSYLYRKMIPVLLESGARVVAPDLFGFGRSDKPAQDSTYTFTFHRNFLLRFAEHAARWNVTLVAQDWGGTLGLTLPVDPGVRFNLDRLIVMNTVLPIGEPLGPHYYEWRTLVRNTPDPPVGQWMLQAAPQLTEAEMAAYDASYPDARHKAGPRTFPTWPWSNRKWTELPKPGRRCSSGKRNGPVNRSWRSALTIQTLSRCTSCAPSSAAAPSR